MNFKEQLNVHIKARYPVIWLQSPEEKRVQRIVAEIAGESKKKLVVWTATKGLVTIDGDKETVNPEAADLEEAFKVLSKDSKEGGSAGSIYIFKDLHRFIAAAQDKTVYRQVRDIGEELKYTLCTMIVLSPVLEYPRELEKLLTVIDVPYPSQDELKAVMENVLKPLGAPMPSNGDAEAILRSAAGLTEEEFENIVAKSLIQYKKVDPAAVVTEKESTIRKSGLVDFYQSVDGLKNIGGLGNLKDFIKARAKAFSKKAREFGLKPMKGIFLTGVTGCGKTLSIKAMSNHLGVPLLIANSSKIESKYIGESQQNLYNMFKLARAVAPCILHFDEAEKMLPQGVAGDSGVSSKLFGMILTEMEECPVPVIFTMTANDPTKLPVELFTRFDATFFIDLPTISELEEVWAVQIRKVQRKPEKFDLKAIAKASVGWSGREIERNVIPEAMFQAFDRGSEPTTEDILAVLSKRHPISVQRKTDIEKMRAWLKDKAIPASSVQAETATSERKIEMEG